MTLEGPDEIDVLVMAKTVPTSRFPIEPASLGGVDRQSGRWVRLVPFPFGTRDTEPPIQKWAWLHVRPRPARADARPESVAPEGEARVIDYVSPRDGWRFRWPFVRPHLRESVERLLDLAREGVATVGFVKPAAGASIALDSLTLRMRCAGPDCAEEHALPILDWEIRETTRALHERDPLGWREKAGAMWGEELFARFDVHVLLSTYAQAPTRFYVAGLFYPPREAESAEAHAAHEARAR